MTIIQYNKIDNLYSIAQKQKFQLYIIIININLNIHMVNSGKIMLCFGCQKHRFLLLGAPSQKHSYLILYTLNSMKKHVPTIFLNTLYFYERYFLFFTLFSLRLNSTQSDFDAFFTANFWFYFCIFSVLRVANELLSSPDLYINWVAFGLFDLRVHISTKNRACKAVTECLNTRN